MAWKFAIFFVVFATSQLLLATEADSHPNIISTFKIAKDGNLVLVPFTFGQKTYPFILDTAAQVTALDMTFAPHLVAVGTSRLSDGNMETEVTFYKAPAARIGELEFKPNGPVVCTDLSAFRAGFGVKFYGVLGADFLYDKRFQIDFDQGRLTFFRDTAPFSESLGEELRMGLNRNRIPHFPAKPAGGRSLTFIIDSGAAFISAQIASNEFERLAGEGNIAKEFRVDILGAAGVSTESEARLHFLEIGKSSPGNLLVQSGPFNLIGLDVLSRYAVTFDYPNERIYLRKGRRFSNPDLSNLTGARLTRSGGHLTVRSVLKTSAAGKAGVKPTDSVVKINGLDTKGLSFFEIRKELSHEKRDFSMTVRRRDEILRIAFPISANESLR